MLEIVKLKKFKRKEVEEYLKGEWIREFSGIKNTSEVRRRLRITSETQDKRDFGMFSGFRLELIQGEPKTIIALELGVVNEGFSLFEKKTKPEKLI